jgi:hypothetical protein
MGILNLVYCYLFLFVSLAVIQVIYIEMVFCKESMSVPFSSFPWILASPESGQGIVYYSCIWNVTLAKSIVPRKTWRKLWHSYISKLFLTKMQVAVKKKIWIFDMYIPCEASSWTLLHQNRKLSSRISLQNQLFCLCR